MHPATYFRAGTHTAATILCLPHLSSPLTPELLLRFGCCRVLPAVCCAQVARHCAARTRKVMELLRMLVSCLEAPAMHLITHLNIYVCSLAAGSLAAQTREGTRPLCTARARQVRLQMCWCAGSAVLVMQACTRCLCCALGSAVAGQRVGCGERRQATGAPCTFPSAADPLQQVITLGSPCHDTRVCVL